MNEPVTVEDLAARPAMSPRTFARRLLASRLSELWKCQPVIPLGRFSSVA